jgi:hypothetical protein
MADNSSGNTSAPTAGGVMSIIVGAFDLIGSLGLFFWAFVRANLIDNYDSARMARLPEGVFLAMALICFVAGILAFIGGIFALRRKSWGLALTGAIAAALPFNILGILAVVFVATGKKEFQN